MRRLFRAMHRVWRYLVGDALIDEYLKPRRFVSFEDASEPDEPWATNPIALPDDDWNRNSPVDLTKIKRNESPGVYNPDGITARDLMTAEEKALWADIEGGEPKHDPIEYPPVREQSTQDWVTERLQFMTGGLTRHPADLTQYPTPPNEADLAARDYYGKHAPSRRMYFSHGYSMQYLSTLLRRADQRDLTLTTEELMAIRSRGLA